MLGNLRINSASRVNIGGSLAGVREGRTMSLGSGNLSLLALTAKTCDLLLEILDASHGVAPVTFVLAPGNLPLVLNVE